MFPTPSAKVGGGGVRTGLLHRLFLQSLASSLAPEAPGPHHSAFNSSRREEWPSSERFHYPGTRHTTEGPWISLVSRQTGCSERGKSRKA